MAYYAAYSGLLTLRTAGLTWHVFCHPHLLVSASTSVPWLSKLLRQQVAGFLLYESVAVLALYYPVSALVVLFLLGVLWILVTNDGKEEDL